MAFMFTMLLIAHVLVFLLSIALDRRRGIERLRNLTIPLGVPFVYVSAIQARESRSDMAAGLSEADLVNALGVSLLSYAAVVICYWLTRSSVRRPYISARATDVRKLAIGAGTLLAIGFCGYAYIVWEVGGLNAYFGVGVMMGDGYQSSGYVYMLKFAAYGGVGLLLCYEAVCRLPGRLRVLLLLALAVLTWDAVKSGDRGDTIRAGVLWVGYIYLSSLPKSGEKRLPILGYVGIAGIVAFIGLAVIVFPELRGARNILTSEVRIEEALNRSLGKGAGSRISQKNGGEFDTAARIIKSVNEGSIIPPGPVHIAHWMWNVVPRFAVPNKHEIFAEWAGKQWEAVRFGCCSYFGCSSTGSGEAYGMMGWFGLLYWGALGVGIRRLEGAFRGSDAGFVVSLVCYLPILQLVIQDFWAGAMNASVVVVPMIGALKWAQRSPAIPKRVGCRPTGRRPDRARSERGQQLTPPDQGIGGC